MALILPIQAGEVVGNLKAIDGKDPGDGTVLVECLVCHRRGTIPRWKFRRPLGGDKPRACEDCTRDKAPKSRQITITKRMHEALVYIGEAKLPLTSVHSYCGGSRTLTALIKLGAATHFSGVVQCTTLGLDILTLTPRWSLTRNAKGEEVGAWGLMLNPDGTVSPFSETRPRPDKRKDLEERTKQVLDRDLSGWLEPTTEAERMLIWQQLREWEGGIDFPALHPRLIARLTKDVDRLTLVVRQREKMDATTGRVEPESD